MWMQSVWISETFGLGVSDALGRIQSYLVTTVLPKTGAQGR